MFTIPLVNPLLRMALRIISIVVFILTLISAYGGKCNPEYLTIPAVLCLGFPYFVILTALLSLAWILMHRLFFSLLGVLTLLACAAPMSVAVPFKFSKTASPGEQTFKIISWNVLHTDDGQFRS